MPVLLLIVGVSLVSVAAIFFLTLAWFFSSIAVRALIIAGVTLATMALAWFLRRRSLTAAAEGIAVIGIVLIALDVWAVRANDLFGTGAVRPAVYAGIGILLAGAVSRAWAILSRLRAPDFAAVLALPTGVGLLMAGIAAADPGVAVTAGLLGASLGGLAHVLPSPVPSARPASDAVVERTILGAIGVTALAGGSIATWFAAPQSTWGPLWWTPAVVVLAGLHVYALVRPASDPIPYARVLIAVAAVVGAVVLGTAGWQLALRSDAPFADAFLAPVLAVVVAVGLLRVPRTPVTRPWLIPALFAAATVGALSTLGVASTWFEEGGRRSSSWAPFATPAFAASGDLPVWTCAAAAAITAILLLVPVSLHPIVRVARPPVTAVLLLLGALASGVPGAVVIAGVAIAAGSVVALARSGAPRHAAPSGWLSAGVLGAVAAYAAGHAQPWLWILGAVVVIALPIALQAVLRPRGGALAAAAIAPVALAAIVTLSAPFALAALLDRSPGGDATRVVLIRWLAVAVLAAALFVRDRTIARRTRAASGVALAALGLGPLALALLGGGLAVLPETTDALLGDGVVGAVLTGATVVLLALVALRHRGPEGRVASGLLAPALASLALVCVAAATGLPLDASALPTGSAMAELVPAGALVAVVATAALVVVPAAVLAMRGVVPGGLRGSAEIGAAVVALASVWWVPDPQRWLVCGFLAVAFGAASLSRGWRDPAPAPGADPRPSAPRPLAWRRLLIWPAVGAAVLAWWTWLSSHVLEGTDELRLIPTAVVFALLCVALVLLRRSREACVAIVLAFVFGLVQLAGEPGARGVVVMLVAAALAFALTWSPVRRVPGLAASGATTALAAILGGLFDRMFAFRPVPEEAAPAWLLLPVVIAYLAAYGAARAPQRPGVFAHVVPPLSVLLSLSAFLALPRGVPVDAAAFLVLAAVHVASASVRRAPFGGVSRWAALVGALLLSGDALLRGTYEPLELVSLPVAVMLALGALVALRRRLRTPDDRSFVEHVVWLCGIAVAIVPSLTAPVTDVRTWIVIVVATTLALVAASLRHPLAVPSALALSASALLMGLRALVAVEDAAVPAVVAGAGAVLLGAVIVWRRGAAASGSTLVAPIAGVALTAIAAAFRGGDALTPTVATFAAATLGGALGAWLLRPRAWTRFGAVLAVGGAAIAVIAAGPRYLAATDGDPAGEAAGWPLACFFAVAAVATVAFLRASDPRLRRGAAGALGVGAVVLALGELGALFTLPELGARLVAGVTTVVLTAVAGGGFAQRARLGSAPWIAAAAAAAFFVLTTLALGLRPVELLTVPPALGLFALGALRMRRVAGARSWPAVGPGLALLLIPSLLHDLGPSALWRVVALGVVAVALVVVGALGRLQAPLVLGSAVAVVHGVAQLWPWISTAYTVVPWWLWAGLAGALLIYIAVRYEQQKVALQKAFVAVSSLR
ncbi:SCO7613 C-terminal domain-containing membrane protein [Microbacterium sp. JZ31]|uniref:SCO7613 C-terminal domain-containing membrane protein n=1 Tax=Microbacterium sp. JZ31 TaxID=1906274 RepID=UPI003FA535BE